MDRITLTRAEAAALLLLTGPGAYELTRKNQGPALKQFPELNRALNETTQKEVDNACYSLADKARVQLIQFNEGIINRERAEREKKEREQKDDLFYKNVTGLLKKLNDAGFLIPTERLGLATARYPEADIRQNRLGKLEYFGRKPATTSGLGALLKEKLGATARNDF